MGEQLKHMINFFQVGTKALIIIVESSYCCVFIPCSIQIKPSWKYNVYRNLNYASYTPLNIFREQLTWNWLCMFQTQIQVFTISSWNKCSTFVLIIHHHQCNRFARISSFHGNISSFHWNEVIRIDVNVTSTLISVLVCKCLILKWKN